MVFSFLWGIFLGIITVGAYTYRTLTVLRGQPLWTIGASFLVSCTYWFSIGFIVEDNLAGYIGFSIGAAAVTSALAHRKNIEDKKNPPQ